MQQKKVGTGYVPRKLQEKIHTLLKRFNVLVCHRRFGKTVLAINEVVDKSLRCPRKNPQYAYFAPYYGQAKRVAWDYLKEYTKNIPGVTANEAELRVDIPRPGVNGGDRIRIVLLGADNPGSIRGMYFDGVILDEFAEMDPLVWSQVIRPALSDRMGWAIFIGTPKGQNHFWDILKVAKSKSGVDQDWYWGVFKASETGIVPAKELDDARAIMSPEEFEQEFECSFTAALIGAYYGKEMEAAQKAGRICEVPHDPAVPVDTYWDLGIGDSLVIWFIQQVGREFHAIDYLEDSGQALPHYVAELQKRAQRRGGYVYRDHILPHDAEARELQTGKNRIQSLRDLGVTAKVLPRHSVEDGINAARLLIPKVWFDAEKCARGIDALKNYERKWDAKNKIFSTKPLHNWASHGADGFRLVAMGNIDNSVRTRRDHLPDHTDSSYDILG